MESSDEELDEAQKEEAAELIRQLAEFADAQGVEVPDHIRRETERVTGVKSSTYDSFEDDLLSGYVNASHMSQSPTHSASTSSIAGTQATSASYQNQSPTENRRKQQSSSKDTA